MGNNMLLRQIIVNKKQVFRKKGKQNKHTLNTQKKIGMLVKIMSSLKHFQLTPFESYVKTCNYLDARRDLFVGPFIIALMNYLFEIIVTMPFVKSSGARNF